MPRSTPSPDTGDPRNLNDLLTEQLRQLDLTRAVAVDNRLETSVSPANWIQFLEQVQREHEEHYRRIVETLDAAGHSEIQATPTLELIAQLRQSLPPEALQAIGALLDGVMAKYGELELMRLEEYLAGVGVRMEPYTSIEGVPLDATLYFIDYRINEDAAAAGDEATQLLRRIVRKVQETKKPPAVFLLSRNIPATSDEWQQVAEQSGFFRFNFRYRDKPELVQSPEHFQFFLLDSLWCMTLGIAYFTHLQSMKESVKRVADQVTERILGLTPADFGMFAQQVLQDPSGFKATNHLFYLFTNLLRVALTNDEAVQQSVSSFRQTLTTHLPRASVESESHALHRIHAELLYDRSRWVLDSPLSFGDILWAPAESTSVFFLVLTPECDLDPHGRGRPKASQIITLRGQVRDAPSEGDNIVVTPLVPTAEGQYRWMLWDLRHPVVLEYEQLQVAQPRHVKWGRLHQEHGEKIQQRFATDLLAVGTEDIVQSSKRHTVQVWGGRRQDQLLGTMTLFEMRLENETYFAFGPECYFLFRQPRPVMPATTVYELQRYTAEADFRQQCGQSKLYLKLIGQSYHLVNRFAGDPGDAWSPPQPQTDPSSQSNPEPSTPAGTDSAHSSPGAGEASPPP